MYCHLVVVLSQQFMYCDIHKTTAARIAAIPKRPTRKICMPTKKGCKVLAVAPTFEDCVDIEQRGLFKIARSTRASWTYF